MRKSFCLLVFVLVFALAFAAPQTTSPSSSTDQSFLSASDLRAQIQNALKNEPTLINDNIHVAVTDDEIDVSGNVATAKEKLTAKRIVQSYAENRKVKDHLTVSGRDHESTANPNHDSGNPATNPDQNKDNSRSQPPR